MSKPILSICIPTYNRANWLRSSLWNWLSQVKQTNGLVELIVCDNASEDNTKQIIEEACEWGDFQYYCNSKNIGAIRNMYRLVHELAQGEFVWVVGDDDLPNVEALSRVLDIIQNNLNVNYIYANYSLWYPPKDKPSKILKSKDLDFFETSSLDLQTRFVNQISEIVTKDSGCCTAIYCSIMRKEDACSAYRLGVEGDMYSSVETTFPHALYIAQNLLNRSCWYIGTPCMLGSWNISWSDYWTITFVEYFPKLYKILEKNGGNKSDLKFHKQRVMSFLPRYVNELRSSSNSWKIKLHITLKYYKYYPLSWVVKNDIKYYLSVTGLNTEIIKKLIKEVKKWMILNK